MDLGQEISNLHLEVKNLNKWYQKGTDPCVYAAYNLMEAVEKLRSVQGKVDRDKVAAELSMASQNCRYPIYAWLLSLAAKELGAVQGNPSGSGGKYVL